MIYHMSFSTHRPEHVAKVLAGLVGGQVIKSPTPPFPHGSWFICFGDDNGAMLEVMPRSYVLDPEAPLGVRKSETPPGRNANHVLVSTPHSNDRVLEIAQQEGWRATKVESGLFEIVKVWVEDSFLVEFISPEQALRYQGAFNGAGMATIDGKLRALEEKMGPVLAQKFTPEQLAASYGKPIRDPASAT